MEEKRRVCSECKQNKTEEEFDKTHWERVAKGTGYCKICRCAQERERTYRVVPEDQRTMFEDQNGTCPICEAKLDFCKAHLDHNHVTLAPRAFLCGGCNKGIGHLKEGPLRMVKAALYIADWEPEKREELLMAQDLLVKEVPENEDKDKEKEKGTKKNDSIDGKDKKAEKLQKEETKESDNEKESARSSEDTKKKDKSKGRAEVNDKKASKEEYDNKKSTTKKKANDGGEKKKAAKTKK